MNNLTTAQRTKMNQVTNWKEYLQEGQRDSVNTILDFGKRVYEYKMKCESKQGGSTFSSDIYEWLGMSKTMAKEWSMIGYDAHKLCDNTAHLPNSQHSIYLLTTLSEDEFNEALEADVINPKATQKNINDFKNKDKPPKPVRSSAQEPAVAFSDLPDEPGIDTVAEALEEHGLPQLGEQKTKMPLPAQAMVIQLDSRLTGLTTKQKRVVNRFIKDEIRMKVAMAISNGLIEERLRLNALIEEYGGLIEGSKKDKQRVIMSISPDQPDRTALQLTQARQAFQRLTGDAS